MIIEKNGCALVVINIKPLLNSYKCYGKGWNIQTNRQQPKCFSKAVLDKSLKIKYDNRIKEKDKPTYLCWQPAVSFMEIVQMGHSDWVEARLNA